MRDVRRLSTGEILRLAAEIPRHEAALVELPNNDDRSAYMTNVLGFEVTAPNFRTVAEEVRPGVFTRKPAEPDSHEALVARVALLEQKVEALSDRLWAPQYDTPKPVTSDDEPGLPLSNLQIVEDDEPSLEGLR